MSGQSTFGSRGVAVDAGARAGRIDAMLVRCSKAAAALFALALTYLLSKEFLVYATEPKPLGGMSIDKMPDPYMAWTPVYYPLILAALFAWWRWPRKAIRLGAWSLLRGSFVMAQIAVFCIFASFLCAYIGKFILMLPFVMSGEVFGTLLGSISAALSFTIFYTVFFAPLLFPVAIAFGLILAVATQSARHWLVSGVMPNAGNAPAMTFDATPDVRRSGVRSLEAVGKRLAASWPSIVAAAFLVVLLFLAAQRMGPSILFLWPHVLISAAIPCLVAGGVLRWFEFRWAFCVLAGEILSWVFGFSSMQWNGLLTGQIINAPPVIGATLVGYWIGNAFQLRRQQQIS